MRSKFKGAGIYTIVSPSGAVYVGSAVHVHRRWCQHRLCLRTGKHKNIRLQNAWNKHGDTLQFSLLFVCAPENLIFYEQRAIDVLRPYLNICPIAGSIIGVWQGRTHTPEAKAKMKGRKFSDQHRANLRKSHLGNQNRLGAVLSIEARAAIAAKLKGFKRSPEAIVKQRSTWAAKRTSQ